MIQEELLKKAIQNQCRNGNIKMTYGIRILDDKNKYVTVDLPDVLVEIHNGDRFYWSILDLYFIGYREESKPISISEKEIIESERGLFLSWEDLNTLARNFEQVIDLTLIGCFDKDRIKSYETDEEMYEVCDIVIVMFDSCYWEVFTKDKNLIERWAKKFNDVEWLMRNET